MEFVSISVILYAFEYPNTYTSYLVAGYLIIGIIFTALCGIFLAKTKEYRVLYLLVMSGDLFAFGLYFVCLNFHRFTFVFISFLYVGIFNVAPVSLRAEYANELAYPVGKFI